MAKLYFRYGAMGSGKTTALLQVVYNYKQKGIPVILVKPSIDTKGNDFVISRIGISAQVDVKLAAADNILDVIDTSIGAIVVDEAQFLTREQIDSLYFDVSKGLNIPVICYGLRADFLSNSFPGSARLLTLADDIEELKTICKCGKKASHNLRLVDGEPSFSGNQVEIDNQANIQYEGVCGDCYFKIRNEETKKKTL